jgi:nicotinate-nucleotide adenylyltransferase
MKNGQHKIGVLGGTFDPPHYGHLILAETAADSLGLAQVLFVPAGDPPHKQGQISTPALHRAAMTQLAIADNPRFTLSRADLDRLGPHYTVDLLRVLSTQYGEDAILYFLMGADSLQDLLKWRDPIGILRQARLGVMARIGAELDLTPLISYLPDIAHCVDVIQTPAVEISASHLRRLWAQGHSWRYQTPEAVIAYAKQHRLYQLA